MNEKENEREGEEVERGSKKRECEGRGVREGEREGKRGVGLREIG